MTNNTNITEYLSARTKIKYIFALCSIREIIFYKVLNCTWSWLLALLLLHAGSEDPVMQDALSCSHSLVQVLSWRRLLPQSTLHSYSQGNHSARQSITHKGMGCRCWRPPRGCCCCFCWYPPRDCCCCCRPWYCSCCCWRPCCCFGRPAKMYPDVYTKHRHMETTKMENRTLFPWKKNIMQDLVYFKSIYEIIQLLWASLEAWTIGDNLFIFSKNETCCFYNNNYNNITL